MKDFIVETFDDLGCGLHVCLGNHSLPVLLDGAKTLEDMGMRLIKVGHPSKIWMNLD